jgi:hypothetical protein
MSNQMGLVTRQYENKVVHLLGSNLEMQAPACSLLKSDNYVSNNTCLRNVDGQAPENGLGGQRHHLIKHG